MNAQWANILVSNINYIKITKTNTIYNSGVILVNLYIFHVNMTTSTYTNMTTYLQYTNMTTDKLH